MEATRLTPHLRRRCLALPVGERAILLREISASLQDPTTINPRKRLEYMAEKMKEITQVDVRDRSRRADIVRARIVFSFAARCEGYSQSAVGSFLGFDHSTICFLEKRMAEALNLPAFYQDYISLYNEYTQALLYEQDNTDGPSNEGPGPL